MLLGKKLHTLADAAAIRGDYSPRDSVWKRYFCNASDGSDVKQSHKPLDSRERVPLQATIETEPDACASGVNGSAGPVAPDTPSTVQIAPGLRHEDIQLRSPRPEQTSPLSQQSPLTPPVQAEPPVQQLTQELLIEQYAPPVGMHERVRPSQPRSVQVMSPSDTPDKVLAEVHPSSPSSRSPLPDSPSRRPWPAKAVGGASDGTAEADTAAYPSRPPYADALNAVAARARAISLEDLSELGALSLPHPAVREVVELALMLLGYREATWSSARARLERPDSFLQRLMAFDASREVSRLQYQKLRRSLEAPRIAASAGGAESRWQACGGLEQWCWAIGELLAARYGDPPLASTNIPKMAPSSLPSSPQSPSSALQQPANGVLQQEVLSPAVPRPDLGDLFLTPDIYALPATELRDVRELTIHKPSVGEVTFHGSIDLVRERHILEDLPHVVRLDPGEVVLYPDASTKPREGEGLNRPATITLFNCMPPSNASFPDAETKQRYRDRIAQMTESKGARFVDYDCERGIWRFRVEHF